MESFNWDQVHPDALDDDISQENPIPFANAFLDSLDLEQTGFSQAILQEIGRHLYHSRIVSLFTRSGETLVRLSPI
jgi:hypothetical protein